MRILSRIGIALILVQLGFLSLQAASELPTAAPGTAARAYLEVPDTGDGMTRIPVSVLRGQKEGPTLALIAGVHGYEYAPMVALQHIGRRIDPKDLTGTLILVHVANLPSFHRRTIYYGPVDGKNLNRAYPGNPGGTISERIAHLITTQVIEKADYVVDMHSGDGNEALRPYIYMPRTGDLQLDAKIKGMALAFGIDHIVIDERAVSAPDATVFTDMTALSRGIPAMTTEAGQLGSTDPHWVDINIMGAMNLMRHLGMLPGEVIPPKPTVWLKDYQVITSPESGFFRPAVKDGYAIAEGGILGELVDHFGTHIATIHAPFAGVVNYVIATPPVRFGEPLAMVSKVANEED